MGKKIQEKKTNPLRDAVGSIKDTLFVFVGKAPSWIYSDTERYDYIDEGKVNRNPGFQLKPLYDLNTEIKISNENITRLCNSSGDVSEKADVEIEGHKLILVVEKIPILDESDPSRYACKITDARSLSFFSGDSKEPIYSVAVASDGEVNADDVVRMILVSANDKYEDRIERQERVSREGGYTKYTLDVATEQDEPDTATEQDEKNKEKETVGDESD